MHASRLIDALKNLSLGIRQVEKILEEMRAEHDPLAVHIFVCRRQYRNTEFTKGGRRREMSARLSYEEAVRLGFWGNLEAWERLLGGVAKR